MVAVPLIGIRQRPPAEPVVTKKADEVDSMDAPPPETPLTESRDRVKSAKAIREEVRTEIAREKERA